MAPNVSVYVGTKTAWWQDGKNGGALIPDGLYATAAGEQSGILNTEYAMHPVYAKMPDGTFLEIDDRMAIVRGAVPQTDAMTTGVYDEANLSTDEGLEVVSTQYNLVTPRRILEILDGVSNPDLISDGQDAWFVNTLGLIAGGRKLFTSLSMGEETLFGDERERISWNLFCGADFVRRGGIYVMATPVQVVCANTWALAMGKNAGKITIPHHADAEAMLEIAVQMHRLAAKQQDKMRELMSFIATVAVSAEDADRVINEMYPLPKKAESALKAGMTVSDATRERATLRADYAEHVNELARARAFERQALARSVYERYQDERFGGQSAYTLLGALIDVAQHREGRGNAVNSTLFGERQREVNRAWTALQPVIKSARAETKAVPVNIPWIKNN